MFSICFLLAKIIKNGKQKAENGKLLFYEFLLSVLYRCLKTILFLVRSRKVRCITRKLEQLLWAREFFNKQKTRCAAY